MRYWLQLETGRTLADELQEREYRVSVDRPSVLLLPAPQEQGG